MYSNLLPSMAADRVRGMRREATAARAGRAVRSARPGRRAGGVRSGAAGRLVRRTVHP